MTEFASQTSRIKYDNDTAFYVISALDAGIYRTVYK